MTKKPSVSSLSKRQYRLKAFVRWLFLPLVLVVFLSTSTPILEYLNILSFSGSSNGGPATTTTATNHRPVALFLEEEKQRHDDARKRKRVGKVGSDMWETALAVWYQSLYGNSSSSRPPAAKQSSTSHHHHHHQQQQPRIWQVVDDGVNDDRGNKKDGKTSRDNGSRIKRQQSSVFTNEIPFHNELATATTAHRHRRGYTTNCQPRHQWHKYQFPTCNIFHEIHFQQALTGEQMFHMFKGGTRETWKLVHDANNANNSAVVLKTLQYYKDYDEVVLDHQRVDALAMERLTKSQYVVDIYGYCGTSAMNEFAINGDFEHYFWSSSQFNNNESDSSSISSLNNFTNLQLLQYARDAAMALADVHDLDGGKYNTTSLIHHDYSAKNLLVMDDTGRLKLNDFNSARLLRWNFRKNKACGQTFLWDGLCLTLTRVHRRSPEECYNDTSRRSTTETTETYHFGSDILFFLLSNGDTPYNNTWERHPDEQEEGPSSQQVREWIISGNHPPDLPPDVVADSNNDPIIQIMIRAMRMVMAYDPTKRPRARKIANMLEKVVEDAKKKIIR